MHGPATSLAKTSPGPEAGHSESPCARGEDTATRACGQVIALIVTYNRKELASQCLRACLDQTSPPDRIFLLDNGSTDGTRIHLEAKKLLEDPRVSYFSVAANTGPASAFDQLFRLAWQAGGNWIWVMDDDVIPSPTALQELKAAFIENFARPDDIGLLASSIVSGDGRANNVPEVDMRSPPGQEPEWGHLLGQGLVRIRWSTLTSVFIPRSTLARFGSLNPEFRSAGVDIEYTLRVIDVLPAYIVGRSLVTHLRQVGGTYNILREFEADRMRDHFGYHFRNNIYLRRKYYSTTRAILYIGKLGVEMIQALAIKELRWLRVKTILFGIVSGIFFQPTTLPPGPPSPPTLDGYDTVL
jgi:dTDP-4-dehydrorhamnose reductase